jgi:hypothetical protein
VLYRLHLSGGAWAIAAPVAGQPKPQHWGEGFGRSPTGVCDRTARSGIAAARTRVIGRISGPGLVDVPPARVPRSRSGCACHLAVGSAQFSLDTPAAAGLRIFDASGRVVRELAAPGSLAPGTGTRWRGTAREDGAGSAAGCLRGVRRTGQPVGSPSASSSLR